MLACISIGAASRSALTWPRHACSRRSKPITMFSLVSEGWCRWWQRVVRRPRCSLALLPGERWRGFGQAQNHSLIGRLQEPRAWYTRALMSREQKVKASHRHAGHGNRLRSRVGAGLRARSSPHGNSREKNAAMQALARADRGGRRFRRSAEHAGPLLSARYHSALVSSRSGQGLPLRLEISRQCRHRRRLRTIALGSGLAA